MSLTEIKHVNVAASNFILDVQVHRVADRKRITDNPTALILFLRMKGRNSKCMGP